MRNYFLAVLVITTFLSCSKDTTAPQISIPADTRYNRLIAVSNFTGDTSSLTAPDASRATIYYSLDSNAGVPALYAKTRRWDLSFGGIFNSFLGGNNGSASTNSGFNGPGTGGVLILAQYFDSVKTVPAGATFATADQAIGTDDAGSFGQGVGWYVYDWSGTLYYTSSVCHGLGIGGRDTTSAGAQQHTAWARPDRTIIVRTASGGYAKVRMLSVYKDALANPVTSSPAPYIGFQYVLAAPGSTDLSIH